MGSTALLNVFIPNLLYDVCYCHYSCFWHEKTQTVLSVGLGQQVLEKLVAACAELIYLSVVKWTSDPGNRTT